MNNTVTVRKEIHRRMTEEIRSITVHMQTGKYWEQINALWKCDTGHDSFFKLIDIFNYGYMMGKRDERAKKKINGSLQEQLDVVKKTEAAIYGAKKKILKIDGIEEMIEDLMDRDREEANAWIIHLNQIKEAIN